MAGILEGQLAEVDHCPMCGNKSTVVDIGKTISKLEYVRVELRECVGCAHWWSSPMPTQESLSTMYRERSSHVVPDGYNREAGSAKLPRYVLRSCEDWNRRYGVHSSGRMCLEIGVGAGHFLRFLREQGYECHGIDPGKWDPSLQLYESIATLPGVSYENVFLFDVLEHMVSPKNTLLELSRVTKPGASMFVTFPNKDSLPARRLKTRWAMVRPFGHLHYFSKRSVEALFDGTGWEVAEAVPVNALHNRWFAGLGPSSVFRKLRTFKRYWKDQFWVTARRRGP